MNPSLDSTQPVPPSSSLQEDPGFLCLVRFHDRHARRIETNIRKVIGRGVEAVLDSVDRPRPRFITGRDY